MQKSTEWQKRGSSSKEVMTVCNNEIHFHSLQSILQCSIHRFYHPWFKPHSRLRNSCMVLLHKDAVGYCRGWSHSTTGKIRNFGIFNKCETGYLWLIAEVTRNEGLIEGSGRKALPWPCTTTCCVTSCTMENASFCLPSECTCRT